jgi:predicted NUDIX family NTP pyrophosphohydrolase
MMRQEVSSSKTSAGILLWRRRGAGIEVLLAHPGGPLWARKDAGHWSVVKGEVEPGEDPPAVARREFAEETGYDLPDGPMVDLGQIRQRAGKLVRAWAVEGDLDSATAVSNTFEMEWPPHSGRRAEFPEVDRVEWFDPAEARRRIIEAQRPLLDRLEAAIAAGEAAGGLGFEPRRDSRP